MRCLKQFKHLFRFLVEENRRKYGFSFLSKTILFTFIAPFGSFFEKAMSMKEDCLFAIRRFLWRVYSTFLLRRERGTFHVGRQTLVIEDHINFLFPWRSGRVLSIKGTSAMYSSIPLFPFRRRPLCFDYCIPPMRKRSKAFFKRALVLGCGGGTIPLYLLKEYKQIVVDVVDMSQEIIDICKQHFLTKWNSSKRLNYHCIDAKDYLCARESYQFIFCDMFDGTELAKIVTDSAFAKKLHYLLCQDGILVINCGWFHVKLVRNIFAEFFSDIERVKREPMATQVLILIKG